MNHTPFAAHGDGVDFLQIELHLGSTGLKDNAVGGLLQEGAANTHAAEHFHFIISGGLGDPDGQEQETRLQRPR